MAWKRNITFEEMQELYSYRLIIREAWISPHEGYEYSVAPMGCDPVSFHKSPRAAYNAAMKYVKEKHLTPVVADSGRRKDAPLN